MPPTTGPHDAAPCPFCGYPNDFSDALDDGYLQDAIGKTAACDNCEKQFFIVSVYPITQVTLRKPS
jgi:hypothetical protein